MPSELLMISDRFFHRVSARRRGPVGADGPAGIGIGGSDAVLAGGWVEVGASVGAAAGRPGDADRLLRDADAAMYRHKAGRKAHAAVP
jgi:GGDEF domain-containing protein